MKKVYLLLTTVLLLFTQYQCAKEQGAFDVSYQQTVVKVEKNSATLTLTLNSSVELSSQGIIYALDTANLNVDSYSYNYSGNSGSEGGKLIDLDRESTQTYQLDDLISASTYFFRAFTTYNGVVQYGPTSSFQTDCGGLGCGPAGGTIIYDDGNGGGIEMASVDAGANAAFGCTNYTYSNISDSIGAGQSNTTSIMNQCSSISYAANLCDNYTQNGFSDWYLPSIDELQLMHSVYQAGDGNLLADKYWSSSVSITDPQNYSKAFDFNSGFVAELYRSSYYHVRAVRTF